MEHSSLWQFAARKGVVLGVVLALSTVLENWITMKANLGLIALLWIEMIAVVVFHYIYLHRAVRQRSKLYPMDEGFSFGTGWSVAVLISAYAGVIVGGVQAVWLHVIVGYHTYVERMAESLMSWIRAAGHSPFESFFMQTIKEVQEAPAPSILSTFSGGVFNSILFGMIFGLIMAGVCARAPRPFDAPNNEQ